VIVQGLSGGRVIPTPRNVASETKEYYREVVRVSTVFALLTDMTMLLLGGSLKRRERISARLGDVLSQMYLISAVLKRYEDDNRNPTDACFVHWSVQDALVKAQQALLGVMDNLPSKWLGQLVRFIAFPFGLPYTEPSDELGSDVAMAMQSVGPGRDRLIADMFMQGDISDPIFCSEQALKLLSEVKEIESRLRRLALGGSIRPMPQSLILMQEWVGECYRAGVLNTQEYRVMTTFVRLADAAVHVDDFPQDLNAAADQVRRQQGQSTPPSSVAERKAVTS